MAVSQDERQRRMALDRSEVFPSDPVPNAGPGGRGSHSDNNDSEYNSRSSTSGQMDQGRFGLGDGSRSSMAHSDYDENSGYDGRILASCNVIEYGTGPAFQQAQRITVSVDRADRGQES